MMSYVCLGVKLWQYVAALNKKDRDNVYMFLCMDMYNIDTMCIFRQGRLLPVTVSKVMFDGSS